MTCDLVGIWHDANEPESLARFWAALLGWELRKVGQNRIHFDLTSTSIEHQQELVALVIELGGGHVDIGQTADEGHVVLADPEGNEFCVIEPGNGNKFLAGTGFLGAVNCDGTRALGQFWSAALGWPLVWDQDEETAIQSPRIESHLGAGHR